MGLTAVPSEAVRGRTAALVFAALGILALLLHFTLSDQNKDWEGVIMLIATFSGPKLALFGLLIGAIASLRAGKAGGMTRAYGVGLALNAALMAVWLWRWSTIL